LGKDTTNISHYTGSLRIDSVYQGDEDGMKGVLPHQRRGLRDPAGDRGHLRPALRDLPAASIKAMLEGFPFTISGFHADTGSEYINHQVAGRPEPPHRTHQASPAPMERQRPGRDQERHRGAQVLRYNHIPPLRHANQRFLRRIPQPLPQLSSDPCLFADKVKD
jgi:hypothetical protein